MAVYKGHEGEIKKAGSTVAYVSSFTVDVEPNLDPVWEMGSRSAAKFQKGNEEITGSFDRLYASTSFLDDVHSDTIPTYTFQGIAGSGGSQLTITLSEVTFTSYSWDLPEDDFVTESVDFQAKSMSTA